MRVDTLGPLSSLARLRSLFLLSLRVTDRSLQPLALLPHLGLLDCAALYPDQEFKRLRQALPRLRCNWFDELDKFGSLRAAIKAR